MGHELCIGSEDGLYALKGGALFARLSPLGRWESDTLVNTRGEDSRMIVQERHAASEDVKHDLQTSRLSGELLSVSL